MKTPLELLKEATNPYAKIDAACKKAGMKKWDGGWTDNSENKLTLKDAFKIVKDSGFKPVQGKQGYKTSGGFKHWSFYLPKAGPYTETTVTIDTLESDEKYARTLHLHSYVDKS